jgi:hypothetical protein
MILRGRTLHFWHNYTANIAQPTATPHYGQLFSRHAFEAIESNVFYGFGDADHYVISTLFGYQSTSARL